MAIYGYLVIPLGSNTQELVAMTNTIAFNTCRTYTEYGQRIAARRIQSGEIVMLDIDRRIDYLLPSDVNLTERDVMRAYDNEIITYPSAVNLSYEDYYDVVNQLRDVALDVWCM